MEKEKNEKENEIKDNKIIENKIKENSFLVIDGNSILNRAFYGVKALATKDGFYTNAIYGFLNIYYMVFEIIKPKYVAVAFDMSAPTFRHKMYDEYKAGRHSMPQELKSQMQPMKDVLKAMDITIIEKEGIEADDILGTISSNNTKNNISTYLLTGDRDSFQLISEKCTVIMPSNKPGKTEYTFYTPELLFEKYAIMPSQVPDVKALMGDSSDNIKGVPGIGEKTAYPLINKYGSIENIYEDIENIESSASVKNKLIQNAESAKLSKVLATIIKDADIGMDINSYSNFEITCPNLPELTKLFTRFEFKKFLQKLENEYSKDNINSLKDDNNFYAEYATTNFIFLNNENNIHNFKIELESLSDSFNIYMSKIDIAPICQNCDIFIKIQNNIYVLCNNDLNLKYEAMKAIIYSKGKKICYDLKSIIKEILKLKIDIKCVINTLDNISNQYSDIMLKYYIVDSTNGNYSIENISYNILNIPAPEILENSKKAKNVQLSLFDTNMLENSFENISNNNNLTLDDNTKKYIYYVLTSIQDLDVILDNMLQENKQEKLYKDIELPLSLVLADIENNGMYIDKENLKEFGVNISSRIDELASKIYEIAGEEFNLNSSQQLGNILFNKLGIPYPKKTKTNYSTDKEILESIIEYNEIVGLVLEYRSLAKLKSTYVEGLSSEIKEDGRIHTTFTQTVTSTGRLSSVAPNLQNIPIRTEIGGKIRECFVAENENVIVDADYSQIELRVLAHIAQDANMINGFIMDKDIHSITASEVFNIPLENVTKELRSKAKAVNFGIVYGISEFGLSNNIHVTRKEAAEYIQKYLSHYSGIDRYMKNVINDAKEKGYVQTIFGRRRNVLELKAANYMTRMFGERVAMNTPIQGSAADIMKLAMIKTYNKLLSSNLKAKIIMQVHDEILIECPKEEVNNIKEILKETMENVINLSVPLKIDIGVGNSWLGAK